MAGILSATAVFVFYPPYTTCHTEFLVGSVSPTEKYLTLPSQTTSPSYLNPQFLFLQGCFLTRWHQSGISRIWLCLRSLSWFLYPFLLSCCKRCNLQTILWLLLRQRYLKNVFTAVESGLLVLFYICLNLGSVPAAFKHAVVWPLKKSHLDPSVLSNSRVVSHLPFLSKVLENVGFFFTLTLFRSKLKSQKIQVRVQILTQYRIGSFKSSQWYHLSSWC